MAIPENPASGGEIHLTRVGQIQQVVPVEIGGKWYYVSIQVDGYPAAISDQDDIKGDVQEIAAKVFRDFPVTEGKNVHKISVQYDAEVDNPEESSVTVIEEEVILPKFYRWLPSFVNKFISDDTRYKRKARVANHAQQQDDMQAAIRTFKEHLRRVYVERRSEAAETPPAERPAGEDPADADHVGEAPPPERPHE